jgi:HPt (histidine-containing phosphotransfer) domain-containing protein
MPHDDHLDPTAIGRLERLGGHAFVGRVIGAFLREAPARVASARAALERRDAEALAVAGHGMISSAGNLGADGVSELGRNIERATQLGHWDILPGLVERLETAFARVRTRLEAMAEPAPAPGRPTRP